MYTSKFFKAKDLYPGVWQITNSCINPDGFMDTFCYLIEGEDSTVVIDTMFGYGNLYTFCRELTDKPIKLINTHGHGDHMGGNFDFPQCWIHAADIDMLGCGDIAEFYLRREKTLERAKVNFYPEARKSFRVDDLCSPRPMVIHPLFGGEIFDLGGKTLEIINVPGHTKGEIVILDREDRVLFSGDACNSNTLLQWTENSIEEYLDALINLKTYQSEFDMCYGGHESFNNSLIDEGIKLVKKVIAGEDDAEERDSFGGKVLYGAKHGKGYERADGGHFNIAYSKESIHRRPKPVKIIK